MPFKFEKTELDGVILIKPTIYSDLRGIFFESYKKSEFLANGISDEFVQDNVSISHSHILRGLHYQKGEFAQSKLVRCLKGRIYDVAVDLRPTSHNFKKHIRIELSEENQHALYIPKGFAHGFVTISETAILNYKTDTEYNKNADSGIFWADKDLNIDWGIDFEPVISDKDKQLPTLKEVQWL